jgi:hypothetical protein
MAGRAESLLCLHRVLLIEPLSGAHTAPVPRALSARAVTPHRESTQPLAPSASATVPPAACSPSSAWRPSSRAAPLRHLVAIMTTALAREKRHHRS